jgi:hypothetical protein
VDASGQGVESGALLRKSPAGPSSPANAWWERLATGTILAA